MSADKLLRLAREKGILVATAESCTGGLVSGAITAVPGSSDVFDRGFVTYSNEAKTELLGVDSALIQQYGAVSEEVARAMADGAITHSRASLSVAVTGVAGPGGSAEKPEGMVCFATALKNRDTQSETRQFGAIGRDKVRLASVGHALGMLVHALEIRAAAPKP